MSLRGESVDGSVERVDKDLYQSNYRKLELTDSVSNRTTDNPSHILNYIVCTFRFLGEANNLNDDIIDLEVMISDDEDIDVVGGDPEFRNTSDFSFDAYGKFQYEAVGFLWRKSSKSGTETVDFDNGHG